MKSSINTWKWVFLGLLYTGGWFLFDLIVPDRWIDFILYPLMAIVNVTFGWKFVKGYSAAWKGSFYGLMYTGGWFLVDLLTPEPFGDYVMYPLMAVVNVIIGWRLAIISEQRGLASPHLKEEAHGN